MEWLNDLIRELGILHDVISVGADGQDWAIVNGCENRTFDCYTHNKGPTGGLAYRKPDLVLLNQRTRYVLPPGARLQWSMVQALVEVSASRSSKPKIIRQLISKAANMFYAQPFRKFVLGLGFIRPTREASLSFFVMLVYVAIL